MKSKYFDRIKAKRLVFHLEGVGVNEWTTAAALQKICNVSELLKSHEIKIRTLVKNTVKNFTIPIVSGSKGYKIALNQEDVDNYEKSVFSQIKGMKENVKYAQLAFDLYGGKIQNFSNLIDTSKPKRHMLKIKGSNANKSIF
jgi:hypothetical protein